MESEIIIDSANPRTEAERVSTLLDYAGVLLDTAYDKNTWRTFPVISYKKFYDIEAEYRHHYKEEEYEFWHEIEDDVIELINDLLPKDMVCVLHEGDVFVQAYEEEEGD